MRSWNITVITFDLELFLQIADSLVHLIHEMRKHVIDNYFK